MIRIARNVSQTQFWAPIGGQFCAPVDIVDVRGDLRPIVDYAGAEQDSARRPFTALCTSNKTLFGPLQSFDQTFGHDRPKIGRLSPHQSKEFGASYPAR
ncbi:MAG: hypothetical protein K0R64_3327 [Novosphingobium lindaniclasticum]|jgi:hypothetical protein|nr:hypothetical protein [Novosphingobium lindaniclasticum]